MSALLTIEAELLANVPGAQVVVVESLAVGPREIAAAREHSKDRTEIRRHDAEN